MFSMQITELSGFSLIFYTKSTEYKEKLSAFMKKVDRAIKDHYEISNFDPKVVYEKLQSHLIPDTTAVNFDCIIQVRRPFICNFNCCSLYNY